MTTTTADLLLAADGDRGRSQQREIGWSELGGCGRRVGYRLAGTEPTNPGSSMQAVLGTLVHEAGAALRRAAAQPGDLIEREVRFAGILGHLDWYDAATATLGDDKTTSSRRLATIQDDGPPTATLWQINGYAAALISDGIPVRTLVIDYLARDTGEQWRWTGVPDPQHVRDALAWLREVRATELAWLPREYEPGSAWCKSCPFRDLCWPEGEPHRDPRAVLYEDRPDAAAWAAQLEQARADKADAARRETEAKGALDALRPNTTGRGELDVGYPKRLRWTVSTSKRLDGDRVRADYKAAGAEPPVNEATQVTLTLVKPKPPS